MIVCTSFKTSYDVLGHSHWGLGQFFMGKGGGGGGAVKKIQSHNFRSPEVGISVVYGNLTLAVEYVIYNSFKIVNYIGSSFFN